MRLSYRRPPVRRSFRPKTRFLPPWLKTDRSSGRNIEVITVRRFPVKREAPVDLKEMKMGADLNGTVALICYHDSDCLFAFV